MSCTASVRERKQINSVLDLNPANLKLKIYGYKQGQQFVLHHWALFREN